MKEFFNSFKEFCNLPIVQIIGSVILIGYGVYVIMHTYKVFKRPAIDLYDKDNLQRIAFGLSCAIDGFKDHFSDEELLCSEQYVGLCVLHRDVCKLLGEDIEGRKLICSK